MSFLKSKKNLTLPFENLPILVFFTMTEEMWKFLMSVTIHRLPNIPRSRLLRPSGQTLRSRSRSMFPLCSITP